MKFYEENNLIRKLSFSNEANVPITSDYLQSLGISYSLSDFYWKSGWLDKIAKGVYLFKNEKLNDYGVASALIRKHKFHIGGRSALRLYGDIHYAKNSERIDIFGDNPKYEIPKWTKSFNIKYTTKYPFDNELKKNFCVSKFENENYPTLIVSERERALIELIYGNGSLYDNDEVEKLVEMLTSLRKSKLNTLFSHCDSVRTLKQCRKLALKFNLPWVDTILKITELKKIK